MRAEKIHPPAFGKQPTESKSLQSKTATFHAEQNHDLQGTKPLAIRCKVTALFHPTCE
jgi:hypothetical protein